MRNTPPIAENPDFQTIKKQLELFHLIFDNIYNGAMVTDAKGIVTHLNQPYAQFLGLDAADSIGKHCTDVVENTRMHIVARTGEAEINQTQTIRGQNILVHRIPLKKEGSVIALVTIAAPHKSAMNRKNLIIEWKKTPPPLDKAQHRTKNKNTTTQAVLSRRMT